MHTSQGIGEAVGSRACSHVIRMQGTSCAAAGSNGEILFACLGALLLICTCNGMLESGGIGGVTGDGYVHVLLPHDGNALGNAVGSVAVYLGSKSL